MIDIQENIYFSGKYHVFMRRVSTNQQDIKSQILADEIYRSLIPDHLILIIEEKGVSANKLRYHEREKMKEVIRLIQADKVDTVYAFDRTRLFRKFLDSMLFFDLCIKLK
ncbi:recombinase family protein [Gottfriedia acidiceleris]|uniref:recombinase family protein n=1 Tax=Gottfriedia acidiceleris TaxID=371036 RepID=UPI000B43C58F|nr:recombinase family protein [Gottfriedia acidiceleris]